MLLKNLSRTNFQFLKLVLKSLILGILLFKKKFIKGGFCLRLCCCNVNIISTSLNIDYAVKFHSLQFHEQVDSCILEIAELFVSLFNGIIGLSVISFLNLFHFISSRTVSSPNPASVDIPQIDVDRNYTHEELINLVRHTLDVLLPSDPLLQDLPPSVTLKEVRSLIALEHGQSIQLTIRRQDGTTLPVILPRDATIGDLKRAVRRATELHLSRTTTPRYNKIER